MLLASLLQVVAIRGRVGDCVFKTYGRRIVVTRVPRFDGYAPSAAQRCQRERMRAATAYAQTVYAHAAARAFYTAAAGALGRKPFRLAIADFLAADNPDAAARCACALRMIEGDAPRVVAPPGSNHTGAAVASLSAEVLQKDCRETHESRRISEGDWVKRASLKGIAVPCVSASSGGFIRADSRAPTAVALLTPAPGIGATTALFTAVDAILLRALPVALSSRLVSLTSGRYDDPAIHDVMESIAMARPLPDRQSRTVFARNSSPLHTGFTSLCHPHGP